VSFGKGALNRLRQHAWPGNVRELRNVVFRTVAAAKDKQVDEPLIHRLIAESGLDAPRKEIEPTTLEQMEADLIRRTLSDCGGQKRAAARRLGIAESTLYEKIRRHHLR
jgi:DNA-binding NtrC family response regulator